MLYDAKHLPLFEKLHAKHMRVTKRLIAFRKAHPQLSKLEQQDRQIIEEKKKLAKQAMKRKAPPVDGKH